jgi:hypothetical protein
MAWQSTMNSNTKLMRFSSEQAICINTGASCSISNNKSDFITFAPSSTSTVLKGISSGLSILGTGTIKWTILNDDGGKVTLHIHNCHFVPDAPMCLLSPQHMAQQTNCSTDGFHSKGSHGTLTFSGFQRTVHYNHNNNLPILFLATTFPPSTHSSTSIQGSDTVSLLSSIESEPSSNLSSTQRELLHFHQRNTLPFSAS